MTNVFDIERDHVAALVEDALVHATEPFMIRACCACGRVLGTKPCIPAMRGTISHGYCPPCAETVRRHPSMDGGRA